MKAAFKKELKHSVESLRNRFRMFRKYKSEKSWFNL